MSFHWKEFEDVAIDDLISTIIDELVDSGGWVEFDSGYNVVRDPNSEIAIYITLEATNKRYLEFEIGEFTNWNTGTHTWSDSHHFHIGHLMADGSGAASGTAEGTVKMSYDDGYAIIITDYTAVSADYRRCCTFLGLATPLDSSDECLTYGSSLFYGTNAVPATASLTGISCIMRDMSGSLTEPEYLATYLCADVATGQLNGSPRMCLISATVDKRMLHYIYLSSHSAQDEQAGIRCTIPSMFVGGAYDTEAHGSTIRASDGKEYFYFIQDTAYTYYHFATRLLVRCR